GWSISKKVPEYLRISTYLPKFGYQLTNRQIRWISTAYFLIANYWNASGRMTNMHLLPCTDATAGYCLYMQAPTCATWLMPKMRCTTFLLCYGINGTLSASIPPSDHTCTGRY